MRPLYLPLLLLTAAPAAERQLTTSRSGHQIHNRQCFSPCDRFIYYDSRNDETKLGESRAIGRVGIETGREEILHRTETKGIGAVACHPREERLAFILGLPGHPYAAHLRGGATLEEDGSVLRLDARDVTPPFTSGSLRGGTHAFHWSPGGRMLSFTYNDALIPQHPAPNDLRTVGVMRTGHPVEIDNASPPGDFDGSSLAALVVPVTRSPRPGSDDILRAFDEDWLDDRTLAFQGTVLAASGEKITELFLAELPEDIPSSLPAACAPPGSLPAPLQGVSIRRLTHTGNLPHPGIQGPRHWVRASPDGTRIAFLARDSSGVAQIHTAPRSGGRPALLTRFDRGVDGTFDWSPDGRFLACSSGGRIHLIDASSGEAAPLTEPFPPGREPRYSIAFSRKGSHIAFNRLTPHPEGGEFLQIHLVDLP